MKTMYVNQLSNETQEQIKNDLIQALSQLQLDTEELNESIEDAMNSRLVDLEDTIDIKKYI
ncbi:hypothetical protein V1503_19030 [Bacillus sp. SCS-151]|uniref:hypothetical protein n=1 Tax=Nanhaiella sioensis TaxID=3115293 RepID=UPI00397C7568